MIMKIIPKIGSKQIKTHEETYTSYISLPDKHDRLCTNR